MNNPWTPVILIKLVISQYALFMNEQYLLYFNMIVHFVMTWMNIAKFILKWNNQCLTNIRKRDAPRTIRYQHSIPRTIRTKIYFIHIYIFFSFIHLKWNFHYENRKEKKIHSSYPSIFILLVPDENFVHTDQTWGLCVSI